MSNVVSLFSPKTKVETQLPTDHRLEAEQYIQGFYDWAVEKGVDVSDIGFKFDAAAIMTIVQGILSK